MTSTVSPYLILADLALEIEFLTTVFNGEVTEKTTLPDGSVPQPKSRLATP